MLPVSLMAIIGATILGIGSALAHGGFENETEVRVEPDRMRVVVRGSLTLAWKLLGDRAPQTSDDAGKAAAKPLLAGVARNLFEVAAGGKRMTPVKSDCVFELHDLHDHAAFTIDFARPAEWPVTMNATFFDGLGELDHGTVAVFDLTASRFARDVEPLLRTSIRKTAPSLTFDLTGRKAAAPTPSATPVPAPVPSPASTTPPDRRRLPSVVLLGVLLAGGFALVIRKRSHAVG